MGIIALTCFLNFRDKFKDYINNRESINERLYQKLMKIKICNLKAR